MSAISKTTSSTASSDLTFTGGGHARPLIVTRRRQARRMRLTVDPRDGAVRLTLPPRAPLTSALAWVEGKRDWIEAALAALPAPHRLIPGGIVPFEGTSLTIDWREDASRTVRREGDRLHLGGPADAVAARVLRWLRGEALLRLEAETRAFGARAGVTIGRVAIGDPRGRWGSCSARGDIRYSWRLVMAPAPVREATVAHEVGHRLHMDHSAAFHQAVRALLGRDPAPERAWLRANGAGLHWVGR